MIASELAFLALGAILGLVTGAALVEVFRGRSHARHVVRVTVTADAVPRRRAATLSDDAFAMASGEPARGGPADRRIQELPMPVSGPERRTAVRFGPPLSGAGLTAALQDGDTWTVPASNEAANGTAHGPGVAIPVGSGTDPIMAALRMRAVTSLLTDEREPDR